MAKRPPVHGEAWKLLSPSNDGYGIGRVVWAATLAKLHVLDNSGWNTFGIRDVISGPESGMLFFKKICLLVFFICKHSLNKMLGSLWHFHPAYHVLSVYAPSVLSLLPSSTGVRPLPKQFSLYCLPEDKPCGICLSASG